MTILPGIASAGVLLLVSACATSQPPAATAMPGTPDACSDTELARFVGQQATRELGTEILRQSGARVLRWVPKGSVITLEFRYDRVTVYLDSTNRVERINCG